MTVKEKRIIINWMLDQLEALEIATKKTAVGDYKLDQCWAIGDEVICFGESNGKQTIEVLAEALGVEPVIKDAYRNVDFLGTVFTQMRKDWTHDEEQTE